MGQLYRRDSDYGYIKCQQITELLGFSEVRILRTHIEAFNNFDLMGFKVGQDVSEFCTVREGSLVPVTNIKRFVGTVKAHYHDASFICCVGTKALYGSDVKGHQSVLPRGAQIGDVICFEVHLNAKQQPQVASGTCKRVTGMESGWVCPEVLSDTKALA